MKLDCAGAARWLEERDGYLILTHKRPDGDTVGCAVALCLGLRKLGKTAFVLPNEEATRLFDPYWGDTLAPAGFLPGTVVSVDIASERLFPQSAAPYKGRVALALDHHPSNTGFAQNTWVEPDKAACGELVYALLSRWFPVEREMALPLYVALATDTGCFMYSNTSPGTHRTAAALMETGIDAAWVNKRHFRTKSYTRLRVEGRIMETLELCREGTVALAAITLADRAELGATEEDLEDIAAFVGQLEGVLHSVTIRELEDGQCKLSVRTSAGLDASAVCALLGGGGHAAAAGCTVPGTAADARRAILAAIQKVMDEK